MSGGHPLSADRSGTETVPNKIGNALRFPYLAVLLYYRLSRDDENFGDSVSIETQRTILQQFACDNQFHVVEGYIDDGWSGTNFDRPAFQRMMDDVEEGRINCIITKDLSRFGREHVMTRCMLMYCSEFSMADIMKMVGQEESSFAEQAFANFKNNLEVDEDGNVRNYKYCENRAAQYIRRYFDSSYAYICIGGELPCRK